MEPVDLRLDLRLLLDYSLQLSLTLRQKLELELLEKGQSDTKVSQMGD